MVRRILFLLLISGAITTNVLGQGDSLQKQINQQVWKPFIEAFNAFDTEKFMSVHSREMTRVIQDPKIIFGFEQYYQNVRADNERNKTENRKLTLELRFTQRIASEGRAFDVGYFKVTSQRPDGTTNSFYGKFHVLLRKENGIWKILMDADARDNSNEEVFQKAQGLD